VLIALALAALLTAPELRRPCTISRVVDGDTFYCADGLKVRLIGLDAPERGQGRAAREASAALRRLLPVGARVQLEQDVAPRDRYGRTLAYAWRDSLLVNERLLREGWAFLLTVPPNVRYVDRLERAQRAARMQKAGLWREPGLACAPRDWRARRCGTAIRP
jgi:micrococcal nuclease